MPALQVRSFAESDDVRRFPNGRAEVVQVDETTIGRITYEPGWRWSTDLGPIMGTPTCQLHHLGYAITGRMHLAMDDGSTAEILPGSAFDIPAGHDAWVVGDAPWVALAWTSIRTYAVGPNAGGERILATVLFTDIVNSTVTIERLGDAAWRDLLQAHNARLREEMNVYRGREIATTGDGFLAIFDGATRAARCGLAMVDAARSIGLEIRVGMHTGEVETVGANIRGVVVHEAQRVMSAAGPGEVLVSETSRALMETGALALDDAGLYQLKGLQGDRRLFRIASIESDGITAPAKVMA